MMKLVLIVQFNDHTHVLLSKAFHVVTRNAKKNIRMAIVICESCGMFETMKGVVFSSMNFAYVNRELL
ncbi:hypothetical protein T09_5099 [Trichinella sp. T9]|nr:hypothetical protein T09_5099 [Trichinella sp. T9]